MEIDGLPIEGAEEVLAGMMYLIEAMQRLRPGDRSALDRHYAIGITELEKAAAYFAYWVCSDPDTNDPH